MPLTDTAVRNAKPQSKPVRLFDGGGLYLEVAPSGGKWWRLKYRYGGKEKRISLGVYPETSLAQARDKRAEAKQALKQGDDPSMIRQREKSQARLNAEDSFEALAREWHEQQAGRWQPNHAERVLRSFETDIFPIIGHRPITAINPPDVLALVRQVERRQALDVANRVLQRTRAVFRYAVQTGRAVHNPAAELTGVIKTRKVTHRPAMSRSDLPAFLVELERYQGQPITRLALKLLVLTFLRPGELRGARWDEFDRERSEWRVPAERMKMNDEHIVPLSRQALAVLDELQPLTGRYELLFPNQNNVTRVISENTLTYALYRMGYKSRATAHGFRATASTTLNEQGFDPDIIERQLAHVERNKVRAAYHRAEYLEDRHKMMQWWADFLDRQRIKGEGGNVVPITAS